MMQLRWLVTTYPEPTMAEVRALYEQDDAISLQQARRQLTKPDKKVLQFLNAYDEWENIPTEIVTGEKT